MSNTTQFRDGVLYFISGSLTSTQADTVPNWVSNGGIGSLTIGGGTGLPSDDDDKNIFTMKQKQISELMILKLEKEEQHQGLE